MTMPRPPILDLEMRRRIQEVITKYPGLHLREIARQVDTSLALVEYHIPFLVDHGLATLQQEDRHMRVYPVAVDDTLPLTKVRKQALSVLRADKPLQITLYLLEVGGAVKHGDLARDLGMGKSTLTFNLHKLVGGGVVEKTPDGSFALLDPRATASLLIRYRPTRDLREKFADLWLSLYGDD